MDSHILEIRNLNISYTSNSLAVKSVNGSILRNKITAIMGPSGCGKSTLLRALNRMHDLYGNITVSGQILLNHHDIMKMPAIEVRRKIGMVFQQPNPFPTMSIAENVMAGYTLNGIHVGRQKRFEIIEHTLGNVGLWDEVKDVLTKKGTFLSGGQQLHEHRLGGNASCLSHVVGDDDDGHLLLQFEQQLFDACGGNRVKS